jgi:hypothetical protein
MDPEVGVRGKSELGHSHFELAVKLSQMAEEDLLDFDLRLNASCFHFFLSHQTICSTKERDKEQQCEAHHCLLHNLNFVPVNGSNP